MLAGFGIWLCKKFSCIREKTVIHLKDVEMYTPRALKFLYTLKYNVNNPGENLTGFGLSL